MTSLDDRPTERASSLPALEDVRPGIRTSVSAAIARRLFVAAVGRLDVTVTEQSSSGDRAVERTLGRGGPRMVIHRPEEFYARLGRDGWIGFGEPYQTGAWDAEDLAGFLPVLAEQRATLIPEPL